MNIDTTLDIVNLSIDALGYLVLTIGLLLAIGGLVSFCKPAKPTKPPKTDPENPGWVKHSDNQTHYDEFGEAYKSSGWYKADPNAQKKYETETRQYTGCSIGWIVAVLVLVAVIGLAFYAAFLGGA